jgi:hypothetical protein
VKFRGKVYVAGPYSKGNMVRNIGKAIEAANKLLDRGFAPFVPHTHSALLDMVVERDPDVWYSLDNLFLADCDVLLRLPGESWGSDREVELARGHGMPVFESIEDLEAYFADIERKLPGD